MVTMMDSMTAKYNVSPQRVDEALPSEVVPQAQRIFYAVMVYPATGEIIIQYKKLARDANPEIRETCQIGFGR